MLIEFNIETKSKNVNRFCKQIGMARSVQLSLFPHSMQIPSFLAHFAHYIGATLVQRLFIRVHVNKLIRIVLYVEPTWITHSIQ